MFQRRPDVGPTYETLSDGRSQMSLQLDASGFDPGDVRVLVDGDQLLVEAARSDSTTSRDADVISGSDVTYLRLSRRYLLPGRVRGAQDVRCAMTSADGILSVECQLRASPGNERHVTSTGDGGAGGGKTWRRPGKEVKFDLS